MSTNDGKPFDIDAYLEDRDALFSRIMSFATGYAREFNLDLNFDDVALTHCIRIFASTFKQKFPLIKGDPGHIKMFGHLLYNLTQLPGDLGDTRLIAFGLQTKPGTVEKDLDEVTRVTMDFANEAIAFAFVFEEFHRFQRARKIRSNVDLAEPPIHWRYVRSMIDYLRPWSGTINTGTRHSYDFYMILKTMDLFGLKTNYSSN